MTHRTRYIRVRLQIFFLYINKRGFLKIQKCEEGYAHMKGYRRQIAGSHVKRERSRDDDEKPKIAEEQLLVESYENATLESMGQIRIHHNAPVIVNDNSETKRAKVHIDLQPENQQTAVVPLYNVGSALKVARMPDLSVVNDSNALFQNFLKYAGRKPDETIARAPCMQDVMANIASMEGDDKPLWFRAFPQHAIDKGLEIPVLEVLTPEYVAPFLREIDPNARQWERQCRPPLHPRTRQPLTCESVLMGGPVLREFLLPSQLTSLLESPYFNKKVRERTINLPRDVRPCFLCCQRAVTTAFGLRKYPAKKRIVKDEDQEDDDDDDDGEDDDEDEDCIIINEYIMSVGYVGAYNFDLILSGFKRAMGICGPVVEHDRTHYAAYRWPETGLRGWLQRDALFFRAGAM